MPAIHTTTLFDRGDHGSTSPEFMPPWGHLHELHGFDVLCVREGTHFLVADTNDPTHTSLGMIIAPGTYLGGARIVVDREKHCLDSELVTIRAPIRPVVVFPLARTRLIDTLGPRYGGQLRCRADDAGWLSLVITWKFQGDSLYDHYEHFIHERASLIDEWSRALAASAPRRWETLDDLYVYLLGTFLTDPPEVISKDTERRKSMSGLFTAEQDWLGARRVIVNRIFRDLSPARHQRTYTELAGHIMTSEDADELRRYCSWSDAEHEHTVATARTAFELELELCSKGFYQPLGVQSALDVIPGHELFAILDGWLSRDLPVPRAMQPHMRDAFGPWIQARSPKQPSTLSILWSWMVTDAAFGFDEVTPFVKELIEYSYASKHQVFEFLVGYHDKAPALLGQWLLESVEYVPRVLGAISRSRAPVTDALGLLYAISTRYPDACADHPELTLDALETVIEQDDRSLEQQFVAALFVKCVLDDHAEQFVEQLRRLATLLAAPSVVAALHEQEKSLGWLSTRRRTIKSIRSMMVRELGKGSRMRGALSVAFDRRTIGAISQTSDGGELSIFGESDDDGRA